ncbi:unnamed protein product, partial [Iphiclides podalirius]
MGFVSLDYRVPIRGDPGRYPGAIAQAVAVLQAKLANIERRRSEGALNSASTSEHLASSAERRAYERRSLISPQQDEENNNCAHQAAPNREPHATTARLALVKLALLSDNARGAATPTEQFRDVTKLPAAGREPIGAGSPTGFRAHAAEPRICIPKIRETDSLGKGENATRPREKLAPVCHATGRYKNINRSACEGDVSGEGDSRIIVENRRFVQTVLIATTLVIIRRDVR